MNNFSYKEYSCILNRIREHLPIKMFDEIHKNSIRYCVIRHDVEYSIERAYSLAKIESELNVRSTYVFQICNNNYNPFSHKNRNLIHEIYKLGHDIGVHVHLGNFNESEQSVENYIIKQAQLLSMALDYPINKFSIHRPLKKHIETPLVIPGYINMSSELFFTYTNNFSIYDLPVLYLADSNHTWKYGYPLDVNFSKISKLQLNCHPFSWSTEGLNNWNNFNILTKEKQLESLDSINEEIKTYPERLYNEFKTSLSNN